MNRNPRRRPECPGEVAFAHAKTPSQLSDCLCRLWMMTEIVLDLMHSRMQVSLVIEIDTILALTAVAPEVHDHLPCDVRSDNGPVIALEKPESHVDAG